MFNSKGAGRWYLQAYQVSQKINFITNESFQTLAPKISASIPYNGYLIDTSIYQNNLCKYITITCRQRWNLNTYIWKIARADSSLLRWQVTPSQASQLVGAHGSPFHPILSGTRKDSFNACIATTAKEVQWIYHSYDLTSKNYNLLKCFHQLSYFD